MIYFAIWNSDWKCIDGYVDVSAASTESVTSYANSFNMRGFWMKKNCTI
jgi:hypothetical protein